MLDKWPEFTHTIKKTWKIVYSHYKKGVLEFTDTIIYRHYKKDLDKNKDRHGTQITIPSGYSKKTVKQQATRLLLNVMVQEATRPLLKLIIQEEVYCMKEQSDNRLKTDKSKIGAMNCKVRLIGGRTRWVFY